MRTDLYTRRNSGGLNSPQVKSLEEEIRKLNEPAIDYEFQRAVENVEKDPYEGFLRPQHFRIPF